MKLITKFIVSLLLVIPSALVSMQAPTAAHQQVTFTTPEQPKKRYKICACLNNQKIGSIKYQEDDSRYWYISKLSVEPEHRHSDKKIGFQLFSKCLEAIMAKQPLRIHWFVAPIKEEPLELQTLIKIYQKMVAKLEFSEYLTTDVYERTAYMELKFNKGPQPNTNHSFIN